MTHLPTDKIPSKEKMIEAVRKNKCPRLNALPVEYMSQSELYMHLVNSKCPCLQELMRHHRTTMTRPQSNTE